MFHTPYPLQRDPVAASALRPKKMRAALEEAGYRVIEVTGYARSRRRSIKRLLAQIDRGLKVDFVYSESATIPHSFTERRHFPLYLNLDRRFFRQLSRRGVPVGIFYRDIYWVFDAYRQKVGPLVAGFMRLLYRWDLDTYARYTKVIFVPSLPYWQRAQDQVPSLWLLDHLDQQTTRHGTKPQILELPPAADFAKFPSNAWIPGDALQILYVGGVDDHLYDPRPLMRVVEDSPDVKLTLCVPEQAWRAYRNRPDFDVPANVEVVHARGDDLARYYRRAHLCSLYLPPEEYRDFAVPVKMYEYLAHSRPVFATEGTFAARFLERGGTGWAVPFGEIALREFFEKLRNDPEQLQTKGRAAKEFTARDGWKSRAMQAAHELRAQPQRL